jgi:hypothetical protein
MAPDPECKTFIAELLGAIGVVPSEHPALNINRLTPITIDQNFFVISLSLHAGHDVAVPGLTRCGVANRWQGYHGSRRWGGTAGSIQRFQGQEKCPGTNAYKES